jgi:tRNA(Ile)-lysidine synthase TilS/MesJ
MKTCNKCVLPETYPGIYFDEKGVCNFCQSYEEQQKNKDAQLLLSNDELIMYLEKYRDGSSGHDVLVALSGGVDSSNALIQIVEKFKLTPLVFHNDHGYEDETATSNVRKLCRTLNADLILWQHDFHYMKRLWKFLNQSQLKGLNACYICGNILYLNAVELADKFNIPLIVNGYSKGQVEFIKDETRGRELFRVMMEEMVEKDSELFDWFIKKYELYNKQLFFKHPQDFEKINSGKILVLPFYVFKFHKTDKETLKQVCRERFDWQPQKTTYPARTTNYVMNWLNTYMDLKKMNYCFYHDEYSSLIRAGEITREQALADLEFNPDVQLLKRLAADIQLDIEIANTQLN